MTRNELKKLIKECVEEIKIQEDLSALQMVGASAAGIVLGLAGMWAVIKGVNIALFLKNSFQDELSNLRIATEKVKRDSKYQSEVILPIVKKFENDAQLKQMYAELASLGQEERKKKYVAIAKYIKSKLSPQEIKYFADVSKALRPSPTQSVPNS